MVKLAPSILAANLARLEDHAREAVSAGAEWLHIDVMDGHFVPNISIGPLIVDALRPLKEETGILLDVHLMIEKPERYIADFVKAGADIITVHVETCPHLHRTISHIKELGEGGRHVEPIHFARRIGRGFGGCRPGVDYVRQPLRRSKYIPASTAKIHRLRQMLDAIASKAFLEVDEESMRERR